MKKNGKRFLLSGAAFLGAFVLWTLLIQIVDVQPVGQSGTDIGFAAFNSWFHKIGTVGDIVSFHLNLPFREFRICSAVVTY